MSRAAQGSSDAGEARARILEIAREEVSRAGWAAATSGRVAQRAAVSKALIHYHFQDKESLLGAVAAQCRDEVIRRGSGSGAPVRHANPVDGFIDWLELELSARDLRIALQLKASGIPGVARAADEALAAVRGMLEGQVDAVYLALGLAPTIPLESVVDLLMTMATGLALVPIQPVARLRRMIESVWLGLLSASE